MVFSNLVMNFATLLLKVLRSQMKNRDGLRDCIRIFGPYLTLGPTGSSFRNQLLNIGIIIILINCMFQFIYSNHSSMHYELCTRHSCLIHWGCYTAWDLPTWHTVASVKLPNPSWLNFSSPQYWVMNLSQDKTKILKEFLSNNEVLPSHRDAWETTTGDRCRWVGLHIYPEIPQETQVEVTKDTGSACCDGRSDTMWIAFREAWTRR